MFTYMIFRSKAVENGLMIQLLLTHRQIHTHTHVRAGTNDAKPLIYPEKVRWAEKRPPWGIQQTERLPSRGNETIVVSRIDTAHTSTRHGTLI